MSLRVSVVVASLAALMAMTGCGSDPEPPAGECPPGGTSLTYQNFGQGFFTSYCTRCHSSTLSGDARNGAPEGDDWDSLERIRDEADEIDEFAGAEGDKVHTQMPPNPPNPSDEERRKLSEWLACGAP